MFSELSEWRRAVDVLGDCSLRMFTFILFMFLLLCWIIDESICSLMYSSLSIKGRVDIWVGDEEEINGRNVWDKLEFIVFSRERILVEREFSLNPRT